MMPRLSELEDGGDLGGSAQGSLAARCGRTERWLIGILIVLSAVLLLLGWIMPIMTVETFIVLSERISILESCWQLLEEDEIFLFLVIFVFSVVFPLIKLGMALYLWYLADLDRPGFLRSLA